MQSVTIQQVTIALDQQLGKNPSAAHGAEVVLAVCDRIATELVPIIGNQGFVALLRRSVHKAAAAHPWLAGEDDNVLATLLLRLKAALTAQERSEAIAGGTALIHAFCELLASLLGPSLTERLLRPVWAHSSTGSSKVNLS